MWIVRDGPGCPVPLFVAREKWTKRDFMWTFQHDPEKAFRFDSLEMAQRVAEGINDFKDGYAAIVPFEENEASVAP